MPEKNKTSDSCSYEKTDILPFLACTFACYALFRHNGYRIALRFYERSGGGGINVLKRQENAPERRVFAIDYHPFWNSAAKQNLWKLHYHRGQTASQISKHRPYEGGW